MYNLISKIAYIFIAPENWIIALAACIFFTKSVTLKKRLAVVIILLILLFGNEFIFTRVVNVWQPKPVTIENNASYDAGIVLGGSASFDKYGRGYFNGSSDRFIETCILYKTHKIRKVIISGGSNGPNQPKDAIFQYKKMIEMGVEPSDIILEDSSRTTFENAMFTKIKIDSFRLKPPFVLITSAMHIPRAKRVFLKAGVPVVPFPCDYHVLESKLDFFDYIIPKVNVILSWNSYFKEVVGLFGYRLFNKV